MKSIGNIRIVSINCRKSLYKSLDKIEYYSKILKPEVYLFQEPGIERNNDKNNIKGYNYLGGNEYLSIYSNLPAKFEWHNERWGCIKLEQNNKKIHNIYLKPDSDSNSAISRERLIKEIQDCIQKEKDIVHIILGDFNTVPERRDGEKFKENCWVCSKFNRDYEIEAFRKFEEIGYCDVFRYLYPYYDEFTIERETPKTRFRCDLAIAPKKLIESPDRHIEIFHLHGTRKGECKFTDHSGVFLSINEHDGKPVENYINKPSPTVENFLKDNNKPDERYILDYGCGRKGRDVKYLKGKGYKIVGYDPYLKQSPPESRIYNNLHKLLNDDEELQEFIKKEFEKETPQKFKHIFMTYVLNTISQRKEEERISAILNTLKYLDRDGQLWITTGGYKPYRPKKLETEDYLTPSGISKYINNCSTISGYKLTLKKESISNNTIVTCKEE